MATKRKPRGPRKELRAVDRAIIHNVMFQMEILPMEKTNLDMRRALSQLPPEEARALKRKFRKLWRKAMKAEFRTGRGRAASEEFMKKKLGVGKRVPSKGERTARKQLVFDSLWNDFIGVQIERFEAALPQKDSSGTSEQK